MPALSEARVEPLGPTYGEGLEPPTNRDSGRFDAKERGELQWVGPGAQREYRLRVVELDGEAEIAAFDERVAAAQSGLGLAAEWVKA